jgi:hypothetical protein
MSSWQHFNLVQSLFATKPWSHLVTGTDIFQTMAQLSQILRKAYKVTISRMNTNYTVMDVLLKKLSKVLRQIS